MQKTTTALLIFWKDVTLLAPSKSKHRLIGQIDPLACSNLFSSERERVNYIKDTLVGKKFGGKNFHTNFHLINNPIKFNHVDELGQKLFTAYIATIKNEKILRNGFIIDESEMWVNLEEIKKNKGFIISPMFKKALCCVSKIP